MVAPVAARTLVEALRDAGSDDELFAALQKAASFLANDAWPVDPLVARAVETIVASCGSARIGDVAAEVGIGERQLQRRFRAAVGLTPKEFSRMRRIRQACLLALQRDDAALAGVSADAGFADQAHLTREFGDVFGWSPRLMLAYLERIDHGNLA